MREAAAAFEDALGWPVKPRDVKDAIDEGRLRADKRPGRWGAVLIPEDEVRRLIEEHRRNDKPLSPEDQMRARVWEAMPRATDLFWSTKWRPWKKWTR